MGFRIDYKIALKEEYFLQKTEFVAKDLIGKYLVKYVDNSAIAAKIVETEAYLPSRDYASHSVSGKTKRNSTMFENGGVLYVYLIYGIHFCSNIICEEAGLGCGVLLRAAEPVFGIESMKLNRGTKDIRALCKGPGNLSKAFGISLHDNGRTLVSEDFFIQNANSVPDKEIIRTKRIGIKKSSELLLRFCLRSSSYVSGNNIQ
jgi:DNA-3-methyladenine glycosylase